MMKHQLQILFWVLFAGFNVVQGSELKLGILCTDSSGAPLADLLTVELGQQAGVAVLERTELDRIIREQSLNRFSGAEVLKVGAIAGADGLVVLEPRPLAKGVSLNLRVIGVRYGVALGWWDYTVLPEDVSSWSRGAALQIKNLIPKLTRSDRRSAPISFVGFTSSSSSSSSTLLEREVNNLFLRRLGAEPDLLVLERQKLLESAYEKVLSSDDREFWNGACLLDGTINRESISEKSVTVHFRLVGPGGSIVGESEVSGSRTNLGNLSAEFVQQVRRILNAGTNAVAWEAPAEAKRFYDEAELDVRWGFWPEARAAADAALALGKDDLDTRCVQLAAYNGLFKAAQNETSWRAYKPGYGVLEKYTAPPSPESLQVVFNMACQLDDLARSPSPIFQTEKLRHSVRNALATVGWVTLRFYIGAELRHGNEEKLAELRATMRDVTDRLLDAEEPKQIYFLGPQPKDDHSWKKMNDVTEILVVLLKCGPLWQETPESGVKLYRRFRNSPNCDILQKGLDEWLPSREWTLDWTPSLCGWKPADRLKADTLWRAFEAEDNLLEQARLSLLRIASSSSDMYLETNCQIALEFFHANFDRLSGCGCQTSFAAEFGKIWPAQEELVAVELRERMLTNEVTNLKDLLAGIDRATTTRTFRLFQEYPSDPGNRLLDRLALSLARQQVPSEQQLLRIGPFENNQQEIERALKLLDQVQNLPDSPEKSAVLPIVKSKMAVLNGRKRMTEMRRNVTSPSPNSPAQPGIPPAASIAVATKTVSPAADIGPQPAHSSGMIAARFFPMPADTEATSVVWADGKLWLGYKLRRQEQYAIGANGGGVRMVEDWCVGSLDFDNGNLGKVQIPERFFPKWTSTYPEFAVFPDRLVFGFPEQLVICERVTKEFSSVPSPLKSPHILQAGDRLFLYNAETILETTGDLKDFKVLASVRRRPVLNALDSLTTLDPIQLRPIGTNGVLALAGNKIYLLATNQWCPMPTTNAGNFTFNPGGGESVVIDQRTGEFLVFGDVPVGKGANVYGAYYFGPGAEQGEIWWSGLPVPNPASRWSQRVAPDPSGASPRYTGLPAAAPFFWLEGRGFDGTIVASFPFHHQLFTVAFPPGNLSRADLRCWSPDARVPVEFPVSLPKRTFYGMPDTRVIIADDCVFVWSPQIPMTWCIDGKELLSRLENLSRNRNSEINTNSGTIQAVSP